MTELPPIPDGLHGVGLGAYHWRVYGWYAKWVPLGQKHDEQVDVSANTIGEALSKGFRAFRDSPHYSPCEEVQAIYLFPWFEVKPYVPVPYFRQKLYPGHIWVDDGSYFKRQLFVGSDPSLRT